MTALHVFALAVSALVLLNLVVAGVLLVLPRLTDRREPAEEAPARVPAEAGETAEDEPEDATEDATEEAAETAQPDSAES